MSDFGKFKALLQGHVKRMLKDQPALFITNIDKDTMWETYLESFPEGTNPIYRERREHDCSCCRHFIKTFGNVVIINNNTASSIWDFATGDREYQPVVNALSRLVTEAPIKDVFITKDALFGTDESYERLVDGTVKTWDHFFIKLPKRFVSRSPKSIGDLTGSARDIRNVFKRSLDEISQEAIETVLDITAQKSLYRGDEWAGVLTQFLSLHKEYHSLPGEEKGLFCWRQSADIGGAVGKIRNHSIGVLLLDISDGVDLNDAVKKYEAIVAPANYKRPKAIFSKKMIEQAQQQLSDMGLVDSLGRRHATIEDISINNILFANRDSARKISGDVFEELKQETGVNLKKFKRVEEVPIDVFIAQILPGAKEITALLENKHAPNMVSLIAPKVNGSKALFKWNNGFSWAYNGNIADSMKERVKAAGGNVDGVLRFSLQWNEDGDNRNDFDAHCVEPNGNHIWFQNKREVHRSSGMLDVDIIEPTASKVAVENITWTNKNKMQEGVYRFYVHNYSHRGGRSGFSAEVEYDGEIYSYEYKNNLRQDEIVDVAEINFSQEHGIKFIKSLPSSTASKKVWGLQTNQFHPVSICMFSPNYWDKQPGVGHRHFFFMLKNCVTEDRLNGFFNEFLPENLMPHKRVFEALGNKMRVEPSENQLSGIGFSSTKRNSLVCKVDGSFTRTIKILF